MHQGGGKDKRRYPVQNSLWADEERRKIVELNDGAGRRRSSQRDCFGDMRKRPEVVMAIAATLQKYLDDRDVTYDVISHEPTGSSWDTAQISHIPGNRLAKGILLRDQQGYWLAVLPASHFLRLSELKLDLGRVDLAGEDEIAEIFPDCVRGAIPPVGECYGLDVIIDSSIDQQPELYLEGGDHATLIHMSQAEFARLNTRARHGAFTDSP
jgi:Ala-tRNA(Pro) deacylase